MDWTKEVALRSATAEELGVFYEWMKVQFHPGELKPLDMLRQMCVEGVYAAYGLWRGAELLAYALFANTRDGSKHLLDYYAVLPAHQDAGWGGKFLRLLRQELKGDAILLEVEDPDFVSDPEEREICRRRIRFYDRNGCGHTGVALNLFGFDYVILTIPLAGSVADGEVRRAMEEMYHRFFSEESYARNVRFREDEVR